MTRIRVLASGISRVNPYATQTDAPGRPWTPSEPPEPSQTLGGGGGGHIGGSQ
jgi:hypothetical protein